MDFLINIKRLVSDSNINQALLDLESFLDKEDDSYNDCILLKARLATLFKGRDNNTLSNAEYNIELNKINQSVLHLLNKIFIYNQKVSHSDFLKELLLKLDGIESPIQNDIQSTITKIGNNVTDKELLDTLLGVLPYPLGIRLRQIVADSWDKKQAERYYSELLYDYAFFYETQLNYTLILLLSQLWQVLSENNQDVAAGYRTGIKFNTIREFLYQNQITMSIVNYREVIKCVIDIIREIGTIDIVSNLTNSVENCLRYFDSESFEIAANFFDNRKKEFWEGQKVFSTEESIIDYCEKSKRYILESFDFFSFVIEHALFLVQGVDVVNFRHTEKEVKYNNSYSILLESHLGKRGANTEKSNHPMENKSVLCFNNVERNGKSLNLFPFLINRNAFAKKSSENDLYQFIGYFQDDWMKSRSKSLLNYNCIYYISLKKPKNIWCFDIKRFYNNDLSHVDEIAGLGDTEMYNTKELKEYLDSFILSLMSNQ